VVDVTRYHIHHGHYSKPDDYVCATGISHTVQDLVEYVFSKLQLRLARLCYTRQKIL
jgi:GDP-D-mannose dehydratase